MNNQLITIITGTSKGIGAELAQYYLKQGHIVIGCSRNKPSWNYNADEQYTHYELSVYDEVKVKNMFSDIRKKYSKIDHLINNAGIASMNHSLLTPMDVLENVFKTNTFGTFLFCREAAKLMQKNKYGRIINFSTVAVPLNLGGEAAYAASKAAIVSLTKVMAKEFANMGITVNAIGPTPVATDLIKNVPQNKIDQLLTMQSIHRLGEFTDVKNVTDFFLRKESNFITGQVLYLGGV